MTILSNSKSLLLGLLIFLTAPNVMSQAITSFEEQDEMNLENTVVPGNLFSVDAITSTGAVSTMTSEDIYKTPAPNLTKGLAGHLPGLMVIDASGNPGWGPEYLSMYIRGIGTYAQGTTKSLRYYLDGFEVNFDYITNLPPAEIASVSILKDAAALATFGMRGSNGIMWIETKRGAIGAPVVKFQARTGVQQGININKPLRSYDYANLYNQAISNDNGMIWTPTYSQSDLNAYQNGTGIDVGWYDEVFKKNGYYTDTDVSFSGGSEALRYNVVFGYANQQGLFNVKNTEKTSNVIFERYNLRTNFDMKFNNVLSISVDLGGRLEDRSSPNYDLSQLTAIAGSYPSNIYPIYDAQADDPISNFSGTTVHPNNPVGSLTGLGRMTYKRRILQANFKFRENLDFLLNGLYLEQGVSYFALTNGNMGKTSTYARYFGGEAQTSAISSYIRSTAFSSQGMEQWMQGNVKIGYSGIFDKHAINAALNAHISDYKGEGGEFFTFRTHFLNYSGRINYVFDNRYVAELGLSYFGSDAYAPGNRYGLYSALSAAWIVSNESFLAESDMIQYLKIRGSVGTTGGATTNESIEGSSLGSDGRNLYQQYYGGSGSFVTGFGPAFGGGSSGLIPVFMANPDIFAEKSLKYNVGLDVNLFSKINLSVDVFMDKRSDILTYDQSIMSYYGRYPYYSNIGKMTNKGFEASISYTGKAGDLTYSLFGSTLFAKNTQDYFAEVTPAHPYNSLTGLPYGTKMGLECIGFYQLHDFNADGSLKADLPTPMFGSVQPGDLRYKDQDGDGFIDTTDGIEVGKPEYPQWVFSFGGEVAYKNFDFSVFFTGAAGSSASLNSYESWYSFRNYGNVYEPAKGAWAYYPDQGIDTRANATYPRLTTQQNDNNYISSSFWIRKNDFLRLKNIELGYDFSEQQFVKDAKISKLRLYVNAMNPLTFSSLLKDYNMDPESRYGYPALKSYNVGIQLTF